MSLPRPKFTSALHDERVAAILGTALGVSFTICFLTGLVSHLLQHPQSWFSWPARPVNLYRVTQGLHVVTGIASIPLLLAKLWAVYPKFWAWPPFKSVVQAAERLSLLPLVGGSLFLLFTGVLNIAYWYSPMRFSFPAAHYWAAWLTIGALLVHIGAKATTTREVLFTRKPAPPEAPKEGALTRRGLIGAAAAGSATLVVVVAGQTLRPLNPLAVLAPRRPDVGPQGLPVNRSAREADVRAAALDPAYRLTLDGHGIGTPQSWSLDQLAAMSQRRAGLPIACVEGWSASAEWEGVPLGRLLNEAGIRGRPVRVHSLERQGTYKTSIVDANHAYDPDTLLALRLNGEVLHVDHGYPARLIAPNRPGVLQTKWVTRVEVL
ncbi:MAG: molybdopterin-dependent oxidoreductase [Actinomycetota bacterium]|nr:molybdopterin-dependent oxidoreductase [Actinomycetota bacterium]